MTNSRKRSFAIGLLLIAFGCFLPWQVEGDFLSYWTYGIRVFPSFEDHGGLLILLLGMTVAVLIFRPPDFLEKTEGWIVAWSAILTLDSMFHVGRWIINLSEKFGRIGAPLIHVGLIMVTTGSIMLLITSLLMYRRLTGPMPS